MIYLYGMTENMENERSVNKKSKIPLPLDPLPPMPDRLVNNKLGEVSDDVRCPLKTLTQSDINVASSSHCQSVLKKKKRYVKIDTRYVTVRQKDETLDWNHEVFRDLPNNKILISINDNHNIENIEDRKLANTAEPDLLENCPESRLAVTPYVEFPVEHLCIRNIKKSLKRPHSRELQGLPSCSNEDNKGEEKAKRRLHFSENLEDVLQPSDYWAKAYIGFLNEHYLSDVFEHLQAIEAKPKQVPGMCSITRACVINWLMKVNGPDGNPATVQIACWYFDSFIGITTVQLEKLQLLAAACYWLSQKHLGYAVTAKKIVKLCNNAFGLAQLLATEKCIFQKLKFPSQPVVPQDYISYLCAWCDNSRPGEIDFAATFLCMSGLMVDKVLCEEYPSVLAVAAVKNAIILLGRKNVMMKLKACPVYKEAVKKCPRMLHVLSVLRRAVRTVATPIYEYKTPFEHYSNPPYYIAQRIVNAAKEFAIVDSKNVRNSISFKC